MVSVSYTHLDVYKRQAYNQWLQKRTDESKHRYIEIRNKTKRIVRKAHQESWDRFISEIEHDVHGRQMFAYKMLKHLTQSEKDMARISVIGKDRWIRTL